jgi:hypothetical protein
LCGSSSSCTLCVESLNQFSSLHLHLVGYDRCVHNEKQDTVGVWGLMSLTTNYSVYLVSQLIRFGCNNYLSLTLHMKYQAHKNNFEWKNNKTSHVILFILVKISTLSLAYLYNSFSDKSTMSTFNIGNIRSWNKWEKNNSQLYWFVQWSLSLK